MGIKAWSEKQREKADRLNAERHAAKIKGKPWWLSDAPEFVAEYKDVEQVNLELAQAAPLGWYIADTESDGDHINIGRTATGAVLTGGISLLFGGSKSKGKKTINWKRGAETAPAGTTSVAQTPVEMIAGLAALRDEGVITNAEFESKKAEILKRI